MSISPTPPDDWLASLDIEYARFNSLKTLTDARPSRCTVSSVGGLHVIRDPARGDAYYHRIVGLSPATLPSLEDALRRFDDGVVGPRIDIDATDAAQLGPALTRLGFTSADRILWLTSEPAAEPAETMHRRTATPPDGPSSRRIAGESPDHASGSVVRVGAGDVERLLPLVAFDAPIAPEIWSDRRRHYGTPRFRIFAVETDGRFVAMATSFAGSRGLILGNAFTHPDHRRRGHQRALLAARLADAFADGPRPVVVDVAPDSTSLRNALAVGCSLMRTHDVWTRPR